MPASDQFILTKMIATIGPACADAGMLGRLIEEGVRAFRINFSHGSFDDFKRLLTAVRTAEQHKRTHVTVIGDISGPKVRVGQVIDEGIDIHTGDMVIFQTEPVVAGQSAVRNITFSTTRPDVFADIQPGERVLVNDGAVRMLVHEKTFTEGNAQLVCSVTVGGLITTAKGMNLPDSRLTLPSLTQYDWQCVEWAINHQVDVLALSFIRQSSDVRELKGYLTRRTAPQTVIAKIEKPQALDELEAIIDEADGVMIARGDLGVEMDLPQVPIIQKRVIHAAHDYGKPAIVATQMLQSMIGNAMPTRAEVSDVANAIYDGADAVMLSGETAIGQYPIQTVHMMARTLLATEAHLRTTRHFRVPRRAIDAPVRFQESRYRTAALAHGVNSVVRDLGAKLIVVWSQRGGGARYLSQNHMPVPIVAASSDPAVLRQMALMYAVLPIHMPTPQSVYDFRNAMDQLLLTQGLVTTGDPIVLVTGEPIGVPGVTNAMSIHYVGDVCRVPG